MKLIVAILLAAVLLSMACKTDFDIEEVASHEYLGTDHHDEHDEHDECYHEHDADTAEPGSVHQESDGHDSSEITGSDRHVHEAGARNHGTGWFFNQPWAATFIWGKMVRDSVILLVLAIAILVVSGYLRKRQ